MVNGSESSQDSTGGLPPKAVILQIIGHALVARALAVAVDLGVPDLVRDAPRSADEIAEITGSHPAALYRLLRMLASHGVFEEDETGRFHTTPIAACLESDRDGSLRDLLRLGWQDTAWDSYRHLPHTVRTGQPAFDRAFGAPFFDYLAAHPEVNAYFDAAMSVFAEPENQSIASGYDFGQFSMVVDVGGGQGGLLAAILSANPGLRGVLFDQPQVVRNTSCLETAGVMDRCDVIAGDFFSGVPQGADAYLLKRILHDWDDEAAVRILRRCREAMSDSSRVLAIDAVMQSGNALDPNKDMDISIMALTRGRERTEQDFRAIYRQAGLRCSRVVAPEPPAIVSIVEGVLV